MTPPYYRGAAYTHEHAVRLAWYILRGGHARRVRIYRDPVWARRGYHSPWRVEEVE